MYHHTISRTIMFWALALFLPGLLFAGTYSGGNGTSVGDPYLIANLNDLSELCQTSADWASGKYFKQTADIDASATQYWDDVDDESSPDGNLYNDPNDGTSTGNNEGFSPIGNNSTNFSGVYDGDGYTISGLYIDRSSTDYVGFFGYVSGGDGISDLGLESVDVTGASYTGGFAGRACPVSNCYSTGDVHGTSNVGGFLGYSSNISDCYTTCSVRGTGDNVGGFVGYGGYIFESYSTGDAHGSGNNVGGFVGYCNQAIWRCYSTGLSYTDGGDNAGGFVGYKFSGDIFDCYSRGDVLALGGDENWTGGFAGYFRAGGVIENCYSTGTTANNGGFIGYNDGGCTNCFWDTETSNEGSAVSEGNTAGITGKTTIQMKALATFTDAGWDFEDETANGSDDYWDIDLSGSYNSGYPFLSWQDDIDESLPVVLSEWSGSSSSKGIILQWVTESEIENLGFIIERKSASENTWREIAHFKTVVDLEGQGSVNHRTDYQYTDQWVQDGFSYDYRLSDVDYHGKVNYHPAITVTMKSAFSSVRPDHFGLIDAFPNPFNPQITVPLALPEQSDVQLVIYDILGQEVMSLVSGHLAAGRHQMIWNGKSSHGKPVASGIYILSCRVRAIESGKQLNATQKILKLE